MKLTDKQRRIKVREDWLAESDLNKLAHQAVRDEMVRQYLSTDLAESDGHVNWQFNLIANAVLKVLRSKDML